MLITDEAGQAIFFIIHKSLFRLGDYVCWIFAVPYINTAARFNSIAVRFSDSGATGETTSFAACSVRFQINSKKSPIHQNNNNNK